MTTDEWVRRLNKLAAEMDETCNMAHPSAWPEMTKEKRERWHRLAAQPVADERYGKAEQGELG
jgi:hypothetical protein